ncbi:MAG TPA: phosphatidate cytidylyltransferase [Flavobacterium sp.]|jgi:phosphatidate cytidylyltransferase
MKETLTRLLSGVVYVILLIAATTYSFNTFLLLFGLFMIVCVIEFCSLVGLHKAIPLIIACSGFILFAYFPAPKSNTSFVTTENLLLLATLLISAKCLQFLFSSTQRTDTISKFVYLIGYVILPFILITKLPLGKIGYNPKIVISIFILIWTNDTFAYIVGKRIGKRKLFERISPKKTVEGFIGGLVFGIVAGVLIAEYYIGESVAKWTVIALIAGVFGTLGDLVESKFKRFADVKDSGRIMPGHGGILDRLDSVIFAVPFIFLFYQIIYYVS